ncbi:hypothetical protein KSS87_007731 [Heliosperma pusillum]|nr:hypothetical protein KSS87_007731 [Heliosperma pusillum]
MLSGKASPVLTDASPIKDARVGLHSTLMPGASFSTGLYIQNSKKKSSKLEDVLSNGWLDAMRSSSPPRKKLLKDFKLEVVPDDSDLGYSSWMMRDAVRNVAKYFPTAIISGRSRDKVYELVGLTELYYAGSHGMDIMGPKHKECDETHSNSVNSTDLQSAFN